MRPLEKAELVGAIAHQQVLGLLVVVQHLQVILPKDGVLWAYPTLNAKGLAEASPLHIKVVAGA